MRKAAGFLLAVLFTACSSSPVPAGVLPPAQMYPVVRDIMQADEFLNNFAVKDSSVTIKQRRSILYTQVFALHYTDRKAFYDSYKYYQQHPALMKTLFDSVAESLKKKEIKIKSGRPENGDSLRKNLL